MVTRDVASPRQIAANSLASAAGRAMYAFNRDSTSFYNRQNRNFVREHNRSAKMAAIWMVGMFMF
jgi:hypothetical protein